MRFNYTKAILSISSVILFAGLIIPPVAEEYGWVKEGNNANSEFGFWIDGGGDVNGDGYSDVIVGAPEYTHAFAGEGAVFIFFGSSTGLADTAGWVKYGEHDSSGFGRCVSIRGDVNNDGYADILIGSHQFKNTKVNEGKAYLYLGGPDGPDTTAYWSMVGNRKGAKLGEALVIAGDLNKDGYDEICVGAHGWDDDEVLGDLGNKAGKFWVFNGNEDGVDATPSMTCVGIVEDANLGVSMDKAGDVNGDGIDDLNIGGYIFLIGDGMLCTFHGGIGGADAIPDFMVAGGAMDTSFFAINLSSAGDVNGDGYDDAVVGSPRFDANGIYQSGRLNVYYGGPSGLTSDISWVVSGTQYDERFAFNVNEAGDINHDGYGDLLVGSKYYDNGDITNAGKAELYLGGPKGLQRNPTWTFKGPDSNAVIGTNLCNAGDINGDGFDDIVVSGDEYSGDLGREGIVYAFYGQAQECDPPDHPAIYFITPNSVTIGWNWIYGAQKYRLYLKRVDVVGMQYSIPTQDSVVIVGGLVPGAHYIGYVQAKCDGGWTDRSMMLDIFTPTLKEGVVTEINVFPTLVSDHISVIPGSATGIASVRIFDAKGLLVFNKQYQVNDANTVLIVNEVREFSNGNYFILVESNGNKTTKQFVKQ